MNEKIEKVLARRRDLRAAVALVYGGEIDAAELHTATEELLEARETTPDWSVGFFHGRIGSAFNCPSICDPWGYEAGFAEGLTRRRVGAN